MTIQHGNRLRTIFYCLKGQVAPGSSIKQLRVTLKMMKMAIVRVQHCLGYTHFQFKLHHKTVCLCQKNICDNVSLGPDFTTANFVVIATFETEHPYSNDENTALDITCDSTHNVAYLIMQFNTEKCCDYVTLTDLVDNTQILREFLITSFILMCTRRVW